MNVREWAVHATAPGWRECARGAAEATGDADVR
jgi:hypothetical protein